MVEVVVNNVRPTQAHHFTFVSLDEHLKSTNMRETLQRIAPGCTVIPATRVTEGAACTVLLARDVINNNHPLMIANSDQWVNIDINEYLSVMEREQPEGLIMTMWADDPKLSYVRLDEQGKVAEVVEKQVISNDATVGIYNFRYGRDFVQAAEQMIAKDLRVKGEFYVAPVYNDMIAWGARVVVHNVGRVGQDMYGLGTPSDLEWFLRQPASREAVRR
jgi:dTDP-glucose pyrophosphorylase